MKYIVLHFIKDAYIVYILHSIVLTSDWSVQSIANLLIQLNNEHWYAQKIAVIFNNEKH